ncbi:PhzF family phenazine biosynthesis protein [Geodermatophilus marinus]|uniref:PhzF family phenazine biosynthesis protein n=1 Tax=Geodermatophilus sp. LHW52908 TaxID=2303986 RepID=UPI000E3B5FF9|nr:PhzF family phenazine biosynthesis protein [Geodermatophilus sp. LHW52908]RFU20874.1 PhzF family phenazine biosynthesis protein [Geodermatophilus sp. LHW52908]
MPARPFAQVDVFGRTAYRGNPVAVVLDGDGLPDEAMARFAHWTNLSETTFVLPPTVPEADYRLRIFTPGGELPFAGHPTLGSAHAWLQAGGRPRRADAVVQECGADLVEIARDGGALAFQAPPLVRSGPVDEADLQRIVRGLGVDRADVVAAQWVDNGPGWVAVQLASAQAVLDLDPRGPEMDEYDVGVVGAYPGGAPLQFELRAFCLPVGIREDPVTGSLNAGVAQWLIGAGAAPPSYRAGQGSRVGRDGVVQIDSRDGAVWVGGATVTCIRGSVDL